MNSVHLDYLVLESCASHLDIISRIALEPVSRRFAEVLLLANAASKISLTVRVDELRMAEGINPQICISIASGSKCANWKTTIPRWKAPFFLSPVHRTAEIIHVQRPVSLLGNLGRIILQTSHPLKESSISDSMKDNLGLEENTTAIVICRSLLEVFSRFKHFNRLKFLPSSTWTRFAIDLMLKIISLEGFQPASVKQLVYSPGGYCDPLSDSFKFSQRDCCLIEMLAPFLEEVMVLDGELPRAGSDLSRQFWTAISMCATLKKLYLCRLCDHPNLFLNTDLRDCLQSLKISEFHTYGNNEKDLNSDWLFEAFRNNENLRRLYINPAYRNIIGELAMPAALDIIARLSSVELAITSSDFQGFFNEMHTKIRKIFRALPENGYVNVEDIIHADEGVEDVETVKALAFWIRLCDETQKAIRLYARITRPFQAGAIAISRQAIDDLQKEDEFTGIKIDHYTNRSVLQFKNARVTLRCKLLTWKKYLAPEYVCSRGHHIG